MSAHESLCRKFKNDNKLCSYVTIIKRCTRSWECSEYIRVARGARRENKKHNVKNLQQKCIVKTDFKSSL